MKKIEFLAASLPYGLKLQFKEREEKYCRKQVIGTLGGIYSDGIIGCFDTVNSTPTKFKPIIRPIDSLTKECVQADYNDGKPFIPIVELAKRAMEEFGEKCEDNGNIHSGANWVSIFLNDWHFGIQLNDYGTDIFLYDNKQMGRVIDSFGFYLQLLKWHFWPNMPEGEEVVYVTNEFNPYK